MKSIYKLLLAIIPMLALAACSKDDPFPNPFDRPTGGLSTKTLLVELQNEENIIKPSSPKKLPKFAAKIEKDEFDITIFEDGKDSPVVSYKYSEMPEIITLPVGKYIARASYGENQTAAFDAPYFEGQKAFEIFADQITDNIGTIKAKFSNVRVTILFDPNLIAHMSPDSKVTVKVGDKGSLEFTPDDQNRSGYFAYIADSHTLAAEFSGKIDGADDSKVVTFSNVAPGNHYRITFKIATLDGEDVGDHESGLVVDGTIEKTDMNVNVEEEWVPIDDDRTDPDIPNPPVGPDPPVVSDGPSVEPEDPIDSNKMNVVNSASHVVINIKSDKGIQKFQVNIISDALEGLVPEVLDLVNPGENLDMLLELGLLKADKPSLKNEKEIKFDISGFMSMLSALGDGEHTFRLTVGDADGEVVKELKLKMIND